MAVTREDKVPDGRIFYGWWVVAASIVGLSTGPAQFAFGSLGLFIIPLGDEFGWDRAQISLALFAFTVALAICLPIAGWLVDRLGSRRVLLPSILIVAVLLALLPLILSQIWHLFLIFALIGSLGAGANSLPYMLTISAWFDRKRGLAIGIAMAGSGLGYAYVPPLVQYINESLGWRAGFWVLAAITVCIALPLVYWWFRETPEELGLQADGDDHTDIDIDTPPTAGPKTNMGIPRSDALRTKAFWLLFLVFCTLSFSLYGLLPHIVPMLSDRGLQPSTAALAASSIGVTIMVARVVVGYLIDRFFAPHVAMMFFLSSAVGLGILATGTAGPSVFLATVLVGLSIGAEIDLMAYLTTRYFGLRHFGEIYGLLFASLLIGTSFGPVTYGYVYESQGSYVWILALCCALNGGASLLTGLLPKYPALETLDDTHA